MNQPSFPFLGFHYDIARGAYLRPEYFQEAIRHAAHRGFTHFLPYLENMIRLPSMERACPEVAYTKENWRTFEATAQESGIELVPHFNVIGHTEHICAVYPELAGPTGGRELDVDRQETRDWVLSCLEEFCAISKGRYFLIGGDEWQTPNHLLDRHAGQVGKLWANHINQAVEFLSRRGRIPLVWHDMLLHYPEALEHLSREAVVMFWFYDADQDYPVLETFRKHGFRTIMASGCHGHLNRRQTAAVHCAVQAAQKHQTEGFLMTSWTTSPWEAQKGCMTMTSEALAGSECSAASEALSAYAQWERGFVPALTALAQLGGLARFPDCRAYLEAGLNGDAETQRSLYEKHQYPEGPFYETIGRVPEEPTASAIATPYVKQMHFGLEVSEEGETGPVLRFTNRDETFVIYPRYGASLQDWRLSNHPIIAHNLPSFLAANQFGPGGYRSYTQVGGFRAVWALGAHHNPCILWQHPFQWKRLGGPGIGVELTLSLGHCEIRYEVRVEEGKPGFHFEAQATPLRGDLHGAWNFNLPLMVEAPDRSHLSWDGVAETNQEPRWLPGVRTVRLATPHWKLDVVPERGPTAGYFVDRQPSWITPDLHGVYQLREEGEAITAAWRFSLST